MKNRNLRTLVLLRSLPMVVVPLWFFVYKSSIPTAFVWLVILGLALGIKEKLDKEIQVQILAWGILGIHLYRGIIFWIRDRMGSIC